MEEKRLGVSKQSVRTPYAMTALGVVWKIVLEGGRTEDSNVGAASGLSEQWGQFLEFPPFRVTPPPGLPTDEYRTYWEAVARVGPPMSAKMQVANVRLDQRGQSGWVRPQLRLPAGRSRAATKDDLAQFESCIDRYVEAAGIQYHQVAAATVIEKVGNQPTILLSPVAINAEGWGPLPTNFDENQPEVGGETALDQVHSALPETVELPSVLIRFLSRWNRRVEDSEPRSGGRSPLRLVSVSVVTVLTLIAGIGLWGVHEEIGGLFAPRPTMEMEEVQPRLACPTLDEAAETLVSLLQSRATAMQEESLIGLARVEGWDLVLSDAIDLARRHNAGEPFPVPTYQVGINRVTCASKWLEVTATIGGLSAEQETLRPAVLTLRLQSTPLRIWRAEPVVHPKSEKS